MGQTTQTPPGVRPCNLKSARGLVKFGGEWVALPHAHKATGFKAKSAYGHSPVFQQETTKGAMENSIVTSVPPAPGSKASATPTKRLMSYTPHATRNRPKYMVRFCVGLAPDVDVKDVCRRGLQMENTVGSRFGIHPSIKTERYRGSSQIKFESTDPETKKPWKSTNQAFGECTDVQATTGLCNQGICSDVAKRVHKKIGIYGI